MKDKVVQLTRFIHGYIQKVSMQMRAKIFIITTITVLLLVLISLIVHFYSRHKYEEAYNSLVTYGKSIAFNQSRSYLSDQKLKETLRCNHECASMSHENLIDRAKIDFFEHKPEKLENRINYIKELSSTVWLRLSLDSSYIDKQVKDFFTTLSLICVSIAIPLIWIISLSMSYLFKPLRSLTELCYELHEGKQPRQIAKGNYEIKELYDAIITLHQRNKLLNQHNMDLIKEAAHELKAPIAIMQARVTLFEMDDTYDKQLFVQENYQDIDAINNKLKELLFLKEIERDVEQGDLTQVSMKDVCKLIQEKFRPMMQLRKLSVDSNWDETFYVQTHKEALKKVLGSIFENLFIHAEEKSTLHIRINVRKKSMTLVSQISSQENSLHFSSQIGTKIIKRFSKELHYRIQRKSLKGFYITKLTFTDDMLPKVTNS